MTESPPSAVPGGRLERPAASREEREAEALRENLRRRKEQARAREKAAAAAKPD